MGFDWVLFLGISFVGPYFGGGMCARLEKKVTGEVRLDDVFRTKRMISSLISIVLSYMVTHLIIIQINERTSQDLELLIRVLSVIIGVSIYLCFQMTIYRILIRKDKKM